MNTYTNAENQVSLEDNQLNSFSLQELEIVDMSQLNLGETENFSDLRELQEMFIDRFMA